MPFGLSVYSIQNKFIVTYFGFQLVKRIVVKLSFFFLGLGGGGRGGGGGSGDSNRVTAQKLNPTTRTRVP